MTPEFSRPQRIDRIGSVPATLTIEAEAEERARLAERFSLIAVESLSAEFTVRREGEAILAEGRVNASVLQSCIATGDPVPATIEEAVTLRFLPEPADGIGEEVEIDADAADTLFHDGAAIDLGEAAAETMALALDPYPRSPTAEAALREAGVKREDEVTSGAFAGLKDLLKGG